MPSEKAPQTAQAGKRGFAALSSLASTIDEVPSEAGMGDSPPSRPRTPSPYDSDTRTAPPRPQTTSDTSPRASRPSGVKWIWILGGIAVAVWVFYGSHESPDRLSQPSTTTWSSPPPAPQTAVVAEFLQPPVGQDNILSTAQIRWCLRAEIILNTERPLIMTDSQQLQFNAGVDDYNARCASFRYQSGDLDSARQDVEQLRSQIVEAARLMLN